MDKSTNTQKHKTTNDVCKDVFQYFYVVYVVNITPIE